MAWDPLIIISLSPSRSLVRKSSLYSLYNGLITKFLVPRRLLKLFRRISRCNASRSNCAIVWLPTPLPPPPPPLPLPPHESVAGSDGDGEDGRGRCSQCFRFNDCKLWYCCCWPFKTRVCDIDVGADVIVLQLNRFRKPVCNEHIDCERSNRCTSSSIAG